MRMTDPLRILITVFLECKKCDLPLHTHNNIQIKRSPHNRQHTSKLKTRDPTMRTFTLQPRASHRAPFSSRSLLLSSPSETSAAETSHRRYMFELPTDDDSPVDVNCDAVEESSPSLRAFKVLKPSVAARPDEKENIVLWEPRSSWCQRTTTTTTTFSSHLLTPKHQDDDDGGQGLRLSSPPTLRNEDSNNACTFLRVTTNPSERLLLPDDF